MKESGPIAWMTKHRVTPNLIMLVLIIGGIIFATQIKQEVFPEFELDMIQVTVPYPGASPAEIEEGIVLAIEDEVRGIDGVDKVTSSSFEERGIVTIELTRGANSGKALQDVKNAVDRILTFPEEAERPIVSLLEARRQVISLIVYGDQPRHVLRKLAEKVRDDLLELEGITLVNLVSVPNLEISVEVPRSTLRAYNLTLDQIASSIRQTAQEIPGGGVKSPGGEVLLRTKERRDYASEFENIPVVSTPEGSKILLTDIAEISESFEETDQEATFNGKPAVRIDVFRTGWQTPLEVSGIVHDYVETLQKFLPEGTGIAAWSDRAEIYGDRIHLLLRNASLGLFLVLLFLALILEPRLAFWVTAGILISILGSFILIAPTPASINMVSLFAFIVTLGIVVDDAIVVGENIYKKREEGLSHLQAAIAGAQDISMPVVFAVLTNISAFLPLFFVPGTTGKIFKEIPIIVISVFLISLFESLFILPCHLSHSHKPSKFWKLASRPSLFFEGLLNRFIQNTYQSHVNKALKYRYVTVASGIAILILSVGLVYGGIIQFSFIPRVDHDIATVEVRLPFGVPLSKSRQIRDDIVKAANKVINENGTGISRGIYTQIGTTLFEGGPARSSETGDIGSHIVAVQVFLVPSDKRKIGGQEFADEWRRQIGDLSGIESMTYSATIGVGVGDAIDIRLNHPIREVNEEAARELAGILGGYEGVYQIDHGVSVGKPQLNYTLKPEARSLGITVEELGRQLRSSFYGAEALRQQRGRNEVKVMVRLPYEERKTLFTVEDLILRIPQGGEIPLSEAANLERGRSYTEIKRSDGRRIISVTADVDETIANANQIIGDVRANVMPRLMEKYPGLSYFLEGEQRDQAEALSALGIGYLVALLLIYTLLSIPFRSYFQPIIVMTSIPFGIIGAIIGHLLLGYEMSIISMFGIIALSGVVVNGSLVLIVTINQFIEEREQPARDSVVQASMHRFRPIILTSLTTFFGLAPMIFETTVQARFLVPMAISLGFGVLFTTFIILLLVPCLYMILEDVKGLKR